MNVTCELLLIRSLVIIIINLSGKIVLKRLTLTINDGVVVL